MATSTAPPPQPVVKTSTTAMAGMILMVAIIFGVIFGYIATAPGWATTARLWWMGFVGLVFAFISYLVYAGTDARPIRLLSGGLFIVGIGSFYGAIFTNPDQSWTLLWLVVLSVIVLVLLAFIYSMTRQAEATRVRNAERKLTP